jgi:hypothetical protein
VVDTFVSTSFVDEASEFSFEDSELQEVNMRTTSPKIR